MDRGATIIATQCKPEIATVREIKNSLTQSWFDNQKHGRSLQQGDVVNGATNFRPSSAASTSALFRNSSTSKKHTRPPMAKLFSSLELSPEDFLQLQSAAKFYMLDDDYPDRRETVGIRGKGDTELVKLKLLGCVKDFLEGQGNGARFFGPNAPGDDEVQRSMIWPQDKNRIINAVTPLLRRIITNERQRQYALETRGKEHVTGQQAPKTVKGAVVSMSNSSESNIEQLFPIRASGLFFNEIIGFNIRDYRSWKELADEETLSKLVSLFITAGLPKEDFIDLAATFHYHLHSYHSTSDVGIITCSRPCERAIIEKIIESGLWQDGDWGCDLQLNLCDKSVYARRELHRLFTLIREALGLLLPSTEPSIDAILSSPVSHEEKLSLQLDRLPISGPRLTLRISLLRKGFNIMPRREVPSDLCPYLHSVAQRATETVGPMSTENCEVRVHLPDGLKLITTDEAWSRAVREASDVEWMHRELNVIVTLPSQSGAP